MTFRPSPWLTLLTALALVVLLALGGWQWQRYQQSLTARAAPPERIAIGPVVEVLPGAALVLGVDQGVQGWRVFRAVLVGPAPSAELHFVDTGFVPGLPSPSEEAIAGLMPELAPGAQVEGLRGAPKRDVSMAPPPEGLRFYAVDLPAMAQALSGAGPAPPRVAAVYVAPDRRGPDGAMRANPFVNAAEALPPARHLGYAITWWGLAAALVGVYFVFQARQGLISFR